MTLLSILVDLSNAVFWMVSTRSLISKPYIPFINPSVTVLSASITIDITVTFMFHRFPLSSKVYILTFLFGLPEPQSPRFSRFSFLLTITSFYHLTEIKGSVCIWKSPRSSSVSFSSSVSGLCIYHLFVWSKISFCINPSGSLCPPSCVSSYTLFVLPYGIRLLCFISIIT